MQIFDRPDPPPARPRLPIRPPLRLRPPAFLRRPLTWMITAEVLVCLAFAGAAGHLLARSLPAAPAADPAPLPAAQPSEAPPDVSRLLPSPGSPGMPGQPGLGRGGGFLGGVLSGLNRDQSGFEQAEWSALQALSAAMRAYIERVVVPAVEKAAHASGNRAP